MLYAFFLVIHVIVSILLVVAILMQSAKGGGLAGIAGGAASSAVFGGRQAATLLHKVTITLALVFGVNCMLLGALSHGRSAPKSVTQEQMQDNQQQQSDNPLGFLNNGEQGAAPQGVAPATGENATPAPATGDAGAAQGDATQQ